MTQLPLKESRPDPELRDSSSMAIASPITSGERIVSLDVLRGVAVLGILILNIQTFAMIDAAYMNPTAYGDLSGGNYWVWYFSYLLGDQKFMTIFSMLFGAGIIVMTTRAEQKSGRSAALHYKRMGWLIVLGLMHAHLLWYGDILFSYGMCGLIVYLLRRLSPKWLITIAMILLVVPNIVNFGFYGLYHSIPAEAQAEWYADQIKDWQPTLEQVQAELATYRGGWLDQAPHRSMGALFFETFIFLFWIMWRAGGLMLLGMALYKLDVFSAVRSVRMYVSIILIGLTSGATLTALAQQLYEGNDWPMMESMFLFMNLHYWGSFLQSLSYVAIIMLVCKSASLKSLTMPFAAVGRMALTNYLMQTIICTTIFYGHGFGLFGYLERVEQLLVVLGVWVFQLLASPLWLAHFRFGPAEWLWRSLTYWKLQPMRLSG